MANEAEGFVVSRDQSLISVDRVTAMLSGTYWAANRSRERIETAIRNSLCFGVYKDGYQVGFARVITDYATSYYLSDVIIDATYRRQGLGKLLIRHITAMAELKDLKGFLRTRDAHGLYAQFGFEKDSERFMIKGG